MSTTTSDARPAPSDGRTASPWRGLEPASWVGLATAATLGATMAWRGAAQLADGRRFTLFDDAMVSMTYARNLARGDGLVWNAGEPAVEGITNLLWTLVMTGGHLLPVGDDLTPLVVALVGLVTVLVTALLARHVARRLTGGDRIAGVAAIWLVALCYPLVFWSVRGMEVGLVSALALGALAAALELDTAWRARPALACAAACVLGVATRPDFAVVAAAIACWALARGRAGLRLAALVVGSTVGATIALTAWRLAYYGEALPNTYHLKVDGVALGTRLGRGLTVAGGSLVTGLAVVVVLGLAAWALRPGSRRGLALCGAVGGAQVAYSTWVGGDAWEWMRYANRYVVVGAVPLLCAAAVGIAALRADVRRVWLLRVAFVASGSALVYALAIDDRWPWNEGSAVSFPPVLAYLVAAVLFVLAVRATRARTLLAVAGVLVAVSLPAVSFWWLHGGAYVDGDAKVTELGALVGAATDPSAHVAVVAAGSIVYQADRPGVDVLGKSDPRIAALPPRPGLRFLPGHVKWDHAISIGADRPDVVVQLRYPTPQDLADVERRGYVCASPRIEAAALAELDTVPHWWVRGDSQLVRWEMLDRQPSEACRP